MAAVLPQGAMPFFTNGMDENRITFFASTEARNWTTPCGIKAKDRTRHVYIIGKTGMGKSTLLENMAIQDIQNGEGLAFVDPHGKTAELLLDYIPENRIKDVVYFAPFDMEYPIAFNVMEDIGPDKRHLVVSGLMSAFKKIWVDAWSARMEYILQNTLLALLEYPGSTLLGINKMLSDKVYRKRIVDTIADPTVRSFWIDEFAKYTERFAAEATPAIQNKVGQFTSNSLIRNIIGQPKSTFNIRQFMDEKKIIIVNLSKGLVGEGNANLLGSMIITKIYLAAMSRADVSQGIMEKLPNFYLYVDEFQSFANESFSDILSEARKYKLNLTLAHQYLEQMSEEVRAAVIGNVGTMIAFRVGAYDAEVLEKEFAPQFTAEDMVNLGFAQVYLKLMIDGVSSQPFSAVTMPPIGIPTVSHKEAVLMNSRMTFGRARASVEDEIERQLIEQDKGMAPAASEARQAPRGNGPQALSPAREQELKKMLIKEEPLTSSGATVGASDLSGLRGALASALNEKIISPPPRPAPQTFKPAMTERPAPPAARPMQSPARPPGAAGGGSVSSAPKPPSPPLRDQRMEQGSKVMPPRENVVRPPNNRNLGKDSASRGEEKQSLKEALNKLMAQRKAEGETASQEKQDEAHKKETFEPKASPLNDMARDRPKEIPEDTLKKMLEVTEE